MQNSFKLMKYHKHYYAYRFIKIIILPIIPTTMMTGDIYFQMRGILVTVGSW